MKINVLVFACLLFVGVRASAESNVSGGRGGPYFEYHGTSLGAFDPALTGNPVVIGGTGFGFSSKNFRIGGGGGGGFLWNPSNNVEFGMGYGGAIGEYVIAPWLSFRLMIGGGGYTVAKVLSDTDSARTVQKISTGGFILFYPSMSAEIPLTSMMKLGIELGYFLPNVSALQSWTFSLNLLFGKG